ncbi:MAG: ABC transporter ATP-binding protein/permease [Firmicutes bacterium]|nr:ABC transporter ATP-binding protein/permease [Bacillota bacterium]
MSEQGVKKAGIKGVLRAYKTIYDIDKWAVLLCFPGPILRAIQPYVPLLATAYILDGFISGAEFRPLITVALFAVVVSFLIGRLEGYIGKILVVRNEVAVRKAYLEKAQKYMTLDFQLLESPRIHEINERIQSDNNWGSGFWNLNNYLNWTLTNIFRFIVGVAVLLPLLIRYNISGGIIFVVVLMLFAGALSALNSKVFGKKITELLNRPSKVGAYGYLQWSFPISQLLKTSRIYNINPMLVPYADAADAENVIWGKKYTRLQVGSGFTSSFGSGVLSVASYLFIVVRSVVGAVSVGNILLLTGAIYNMVNGFRSVAESAYWLVDQTDRLQSMLDFMEMPTVMEKGTLPVEKRLDNEYEIEFRNVSFKYPGSEKYALRNFSMSLNIGQKLAIVGMNGSGKTTMIKLLCRLYDPTEGEITLNGIDIKKYDYAEYSQIFSVVFQDFKLLSFKLGENLACGQEIEPEKATRILQSVGFCDRLRAMESGLDTYLYNDFETGVEISGGEAQKIALARALYKNSPFILLDEPTAALDPIAEYEIYVNFNKITGDKTAIFISHRLSSCRFCDDIAVFHEGELVQRGNHDALLADESGKYCELWTAQAQYYNENIAG